MTRGEKLRKLRLEVDRTLEEVGHDVHISKQNLYKYENDIITNIPSDKIEILANYYMVSPAYLMGWSESPDLIVKEGDATYFIESKVPSPNDPTTIAAHHDGEDWTPEELEDIEMFKEMLRLKRDKNKIKGGASKINDSK